MASMLSQTKQNETQQQVQQVQDNLQGWQNSEAKKMNDHIEQIKEIAKDVVEEVEKEAQILKQELGEAHEVVLPGLKMNQKARKKVQNAVVEAVKKMQETGVIPILDDLPEEEKERVVMEQLSNLEGNMHSKKDREVGNLRREIAD